MRRVHEDISIQGYIAKLTPESLEEHEVDEQLQLLYTAFQTVHDGVVICDREYTIKHWNKASERIYGVKVGSDVKSGHQSQVE